MKKLLALIAVIMLCSFIKPDRLQRRKGILIQDEKGKIVFRALENWQDYTLKAGGDTVYQYKHL